MLQCELNVQVSFPLLVWYFERSGRSRKSILCRDTQLTLAQRFFLSFYYCSVDKDDWDDYDEDEDDDDDDDDDDDEKGLTEANDGDVEDGDKLGHCEGDCDSGKFLLLCSLQASFLHSFIFRNVQSLT